MEVQKSQLEEASPPGHYNKLDLDPIPVERDTTNNGTTVLYMESYGPIIR